MKIINTKGLIALIVTVVSFAFVSKTTLAWTPTLDLSKLKIDVSKLKVLPCGILNDKIQKKIENFETNKPKHVEVYTKLKDRLSEKIEAWKEQGYDTSKLESDLETLEGKIAKFQEDFEAYLGKLKDTKNYTCGASSGDFANALKAAREELKVVRQDVADIRNYFQTTIRPDVVALKSQNISAEED